MISQTINGGFENLPTVCWAYNQGVTTSIWFGAIWKWSILCPICWGLPHPHPPPPPHHHHHQQQQHSHHDHDHDDYHDHDSHLLDLFSRPQKSLIRSDHHQRIIPWKRSTKDVRWCSKQNLQETPTLMVKLRVSISLHRHPEGSANWGFLWCPVYNLPWNPSLNLAIPQESSSPVARVSLLAAHKIHRQHLQICAPRKWLHLPLK